MLKFFGRAKDASNVSLQSFSYSLSPVTGPGRPICLVYCDENGRFRMDPEEVATLQLVKDPIGIDSVCGRARQGKSFILNQLTALDSKLKTASHGKRLRADDTDMETSDRILRVNKKSRSTTSPLVDTQPEDGGSVFKGDEDHQSQLNSQDDYAKFRVQKEKSSLVLKCRSIEDKMKLLNKQLEDIGKYNYEYLKRYDDAINGKKNLADEYMSWINNLQGDNSPGRPIRLVYCDENGRFRMDPQEVATLQLVKDPIGIDSVCGRARQGKSFILNQLTALDSKLKTASHGKRLRADDTDMETSDRILRVNKKSRSTTSPLVDAQPEDGGSVFKGDEDHQSQLNSQDDYAKFRVQKEKSSLVLKCRSIEDKMKLLNKQLEDSEKYKSEYLKRYDDAINGKKNLADEYMSCINNLQGDNSSPKERCSSLTKALDSAKQEISDWRRKNDQVLSKERAKEDQVSSEIEVLKSRSTAAEARLAAAKEQTQFAQEEAEEWKRKCDYAVREAKAALEKAATVQQQQSEGTQLREDALRKEFADTLADKEEEIKDKSAKIEYAEQHLTTLELELKAVESKLIGRDTDVSVLKLEIRELAKKLKHASEKALCAAESKIKSYDTEISVVKIEIRELAEKLEHANEKAQSFEKDAKILEQEKIHSEQKYLSGFRRFEELEGRCKQADKEAKKATELADKARAESVIAQKEKSEIQRLAMERLAQIERAERQIENLERQKTNFRGEAHRLRLSELEAVSKVALLEARVEEREKEIGSLLQNSNEQRANTVKALQDLLDSECAAHADANDRADALSLQLQAAQAKLDALQQELTSVRLNETALDSKLKTASHGKRLRADDTDMETSDRILRVNKKSRSTTSPLVDTQPEDGGSVFKGDEDHQSQLNSQDDYAKFTVQKEKSSLVLKCGSIEDKMKLLNKQLEDNEKYKSEYLKRYDDAINGKKNLADEYMSWINNLQGDNSSLKERCSSLMKALDSAKQEISDWRRKNDQVLSKERAKEDQVSSEIEVLKSRSTAAEARLAAAKEQTQFAQEEAEEWKRKYDYAVREAKAALEKAATVQQRQSEGTQPREDALRKEFADTLADKEEEIKDKSAKIEYAEQRLTTLELELKAAESKIKSYDTEISVVKIEIRELAEKLEHANEKAQSFEKDAKILEQEKIHSEQKYLSGFRRFEELEGRCKQADKEAKKATELADKAQAESVIAQKEKSEIQRLAMERLAQIERAERQIENLERQKTDFRGEAHRLRLSELEAVSKVALLEARVKEREKEIGSLLQNRNEQRASTVKALQDLLDSERAAHADANDRADALSLQLQAAQAKLDALQQELTSVRLNETALDGKLKTASHGERLRADNTDMETSDRILRVNKKSRSTTSPLVDTQPEDGGSDHQSQLNSQDDYAKFTVQKLKQELTKHNFGAELLALRNPKKKEILALYEKCILQKS